ncbi:MAG: hypothetical protein AAFY60_10355, partial [Myxococcota bacterium]
AVNDPVIELSSAPKIRLLGEGSAICRTGEPFFAETTRRLTRGARMSLGSDSESAALTVRAGRSSAGAGMGAGGGGTDSAA